MITFYFSEDLYYYLSLFLLPKDILRLISINHSFYQIFTSPFIWDVVLKKYYQPLAINQSPTTTSTLPSSLPTDISISISNSYHLFQHFSRQSRIEQIMKSNIFMSSIDRREESASGILKQSFCSQSISTHYHRLQQNPLHGQQFQMECGCYFGHPCYWSSKGTSSHQDNEELIFTSKYPLTLIYSFQITPYQSFFQPDNPIYAPYSVQLQFISPDQSTTYYTSPIYEVVSTPLLQSFDLPHPILFCGGYLKFVLIGKRQQQPVGPNDYYTCLSYAGITGKLLKRFTANYSKQDQHCFEIVPI